MPTVLRKNGFRVSIYFQDHDPPHVHVRKAGEKVVLLLGDKTNRVRIRENRGMSFRRVTQAAKLVGDHQAMLLAKWRQIHGND